MRGCLLSNELQICQWCTEKQVSWIIYYNSSFIYPINTQFKKVYILKSLLLTAFFSLIPRVLCLIMHVFKVLRTQHCEVCMFNCHSLTWAKPTIFQWSTLMIWSTAHVSISSCNLNRNIPAVQIPCEKVGVVSSEFKSAVPYKSTVSKMFLFLLLIIFLYFSHRHSTLQCLSKHILKRCFYAGNTT